MKLAILFFISTIGLFAEEPQTACQAQDGSGKAIECQKEPMPGCNPTETWTGCVERIKSENVKLSALVQAWKQNALQCRMPEFVRMVEDAALKQKDSAPKIPTRAARAAPVAPAK